MTTGPRLATACALALATGCIGTIGDPQGTGVSVAADAAPESAPEPDAVTGCAAPYNLAGALLPVREASGMPALAAAAADRSCPLAAGTVGVRKQGDATPASLDDAWHIGSGTMAMTAALVAQLVDAGVLAWDTPLRELLPDVDMFEAYESVTLVDLLAHTSGLARNHPTLVGLVQAEGGSAVEQRARLASKLFKTLAVTTPGTSYAYSNSGYIVVGAILERATGVSWEELMSRRIFEPLGMTSCGFGHPHTPGQVDGPWGHDDDQPVGKSPQSPIYGPAGNVHCALDDWTKFAVLFLDDRTNAILSGDSMIALTTPRTAVAPSILYALGWVVAIEGPVFEHPGTDGTFASLVWVARDRGRVYVAAANHGGEDARAAVQTAIDAMVGDAP